MARRRVYVGKTKKFVSRSVGPYQIAKRVSKTCYTVEDLPHNRRKRIYRRFNAHVSQLHPYRSRYEVDWKPEGEEEDSEECQGVDDVPAVGEDFCDDWEPPREADDPLEATPLSEESSQGSGPAQISPEGDNLPGPDTEGSDSSGEENEEPDPPVSQVTRTGRIVRRPQLSDYDYY